MDGRTDGNSNYINMRHAVHVKTAVCVRSCGAAGYMYSIGLLNTFYTFVLLHACDRANLKLCLHLLVFEICVRWI